MVVRFSYAELDPRVKLLAFAVKNWAKNRRVNTTFEGTLSSYAYVLMVIHFLQGRRPPVVPVLQEMSPLRGRNKKKVMVAGYDTYFYQNLEDKRLLEFGAQNTESVGTLLFEFFIFYGFYFQYKDKVSD
jgi:DNA polymerase sigma